MNAQSFGQILLLLGLVSMMEAAQAGIPLPVVILTSADSSADEAGQDPASYTVTRDTAGPALNVGLTFAGSATRNTDYSAPGLFSGGGFSIAVQIPAGATFADFTITPILDNLIEGTEDIVITLLPSVNGNYTVGAMTELTFTIADDVAEVNLTSSDTEADEAGQDPGSYTLTRSNNGNVGSSMTVGLSFAGSATRNTDYSASGLFSGGGFSIAVQIPAGATFADFTITPILDNLIEGTEDIVITLLPSVNGNYTVGAMTELTFTIADDVAEVNLTSSDTEADEAGQDPGSYTLTRSNNGNVDSSMTVGLTFAGSATRNTDYSAPGLFSGGGFSIAVQIPAGATFADFTITPILDNLIEGTEDIVITLLPSVNGNYTVGAMTELTFTIADDVAEVNLTSSDTEADEAGQDPGSYTLTRSNNGNVGSSMTVGLTFAGSATRNTDYSAPGLFSGGGFSIAVQIPAGATFADFTITPILDNLIEGTEDIVITLLPSVNGNYTVGAMTELTFTIADDVAEVNLTSSDTEADEAGQDPGSYTLTRSNNGNVGSSMTVGLSFAGSATRNTDYSASGLFSGGGFSIAVQIPAGELSATFQITPIVDGPDNEGDESIDIGLLAGDYLVGSQTNVTLTLKDLLDFLFADSFEDISKCSAFSLAKSSPDRFLDLGPTIVDLESQMTWSACGLRGSYDWVGRQCWDDISLTSMDPEDLLRSFNAGLLGDGGGYSDWRLPDAKSQGTLPSGCKGLLVRDQ